MKIFLTFIFFVSGVFAMPSQAAAGNTTPDTSDVIKLNVMGFRCRLTKPEQTVEYGNKALAIAQKLNYIPGIAESYRIKGIGYYYSDQSIKAFENYSSALNYFMQIKDEKGQGKVYNNIGNLYRNIDYDESLFYFKKALPIAKKLADKPLIATIYLNVGTVYYHKNEFYQALNYYDQSFNLFTSLKDSVNVAQCMENKGLVYFSLRQYRQAENLLLAANQNAKQQDLNEAVAGIDLTLADLYIAQNKFKAAESIIEEGITFSEIIKSEKLLSDFKYTRYQLELKRKNYQVALNYLREIYTQDSTINKKGTSTEISLIREQVKQQAKQKENELLMQRQENDRVKFWAMAIVAVLLLFLVALLVNNVKRKAKTNDQLTSLNAEVSKQKDNLDRINHHLEEIIDERTKDLQIKNKKLSEYSSYLSHQIRGPIATLKGLMNLEKEGLVDQSECIRMMNKCVGEIDDKIIEMSDMLHDPARAGF